MIFLSSLGGAFLEFHINSKFNLNLPILSQEGLSEWFFIKISNKISNLIDSLNRKNNTTVIVISHVWNIISNYDKMVLIEEGKVLYYGIPKKSEMNNKQ